ncbi:hypothetical protein EPI10_001612 [Gossypium australe]|uniref:Uncharacterized protein n=1 Tax=Gossypium australe TaxID=47621 RepID=A0A5B6VBI2_9ROSI|nr:hypothetical protein EPI10_001612 [Gossypium australe]
MGSGTRRNSWNLVLAVELAESWRCMGGVNSLNHLCSSITTRFTSSSYSFVPSPNHPLLQTKPVSLIYHYQPDIKKHPCGLPKVSSSVGSYRSSQPKEGSGLVISASKFKSRAVSAVRDFPSGCGREPTSAWDRQIAVIPASESVDVESLVLRIISRNDCLDSRNTLVGKVGDTGDLSQWSGTTVGWPHIYIFCDSVTSGLGPQWLDATGVWLM